MKKIYLIKICTVIACFLSIGVAIWIHFSFNVIATESLPSEEKADKDKKLSMIVGETGILKGKDEWDAFLEEANRKQESVIHVNIISKDKGSSQNINQTSSVEIDLHFDGEKYYVEQFVDEEGKINVYDKLLNLSGEVPGTKHKSTMIVLANENYSYDQVFKGIYSSNDEEILDVVVVYNYRI